MSESEKITAGANDRAVDEPLASGAPGIPDDALLPSENLPDPPSDEEVARVARQLGAKLPDA
ncbi:hypothetical protein K7957_00020 [Sphingomonas yunnanensis]|uniref:hypothetical protein n=1 Tax=Sphingomonas yunnanensis TaxID=310400 RepID=UPI001CA745B4|nr:hypothetical protein [Sphingomonas yunnanensis]MBY9061317.1 hypothetical protein [Sphingomonas yunnanensis]